MITSSDFTDLPDINVLLALHDPDHPFHSKASVWFETASQKRWATCPITENGFIRIASTPTLPGGPLQPPKALAALTALIAFSKASHIFWPDNISLCDSTLFNHSSILGPKQITDIYLLGLCQRRLGRFVTLDARVSTAAIRTPHPQLLCIL